MTAAVQDIYINEVHTQRVGVPFTVTGAFALAAPGVSTSSNAFEVVAYEKLPEDKKPPADEVAACL